MLRSLYFHYTRIVPISKRTDCASYSTESRYSKYSFFAARHRFSPQSYSILVFCSQYTNQFLRRSTRFVHYVFILFTKYWGYDIVAVEWWWYEIPLLQIHARRCSWLYVVKDVLMAIQGILFSEKRYDRKIVPFLQGKRPTSTGTIWWRFAKEISRKSLADRWIKFPKNLFHDDSRLLLAFRKPSKWLSLLENLCLLIGDAREESAWYFLYDCCPDEVSALYFSLAYALACVRGVLQHIKAQLKNAKKTQLH